MLKREELVRRIEKSLAFWGTHTLEDLHAEIEADRIVGFTGPHGVWVTQISEYPRKRFLNVAMLAGELPGIMDLQKDVERYAAYKECDLIVAPHVRFGLKDIFVESGWQVRGYNMSLSIKGD